MKLPLTLFVLFMVFLNALIENQWMPLVAEHQSHAIGISISSDELEDIEQHYNEQHRHSDSSEKSSCEHTHFHCTLLCFADVVRPLSVLLIISSWESPNSYSYFLPPLRSFSLALDRPPMA